MNNKWAPICKKGESSTYKVSKIMDFPSDCSKIAIFFIIFGKSSFLNRTLGLRKSFLNRDSFLTHSFLNWDSSVLDMYNFESSASIAVSCI